VGRRAHRSLAFWPLIVPNLNPGSLSLGNAAHLCLRYRTSFGPYAKGLKRTAGNGAEPEISSLGRFATPQDTENQFEVLAGTIPGGFKSPPHHRFQSKYNYMAASAPNRGVGPHSSSVLVCDPSHLRMYDSAFRETVAQSSKLSTMRGAVLSRPKAGRFAPAEAGVRRRTATASKPPATPCGR
jgi:hypothetical protein